MTGIGVSNNKRQCISKIYQCYNSITYTSEYYNYIQPYSYYNSIPSLGVNVYSFSLNPLEVQPSGSCNFSRIPKISLEVNLLKNINDFILNNELNLEIIGTNYNILRIIGGIAGLAYTY